MAAISEKKTDWKKLRQKLAQVTDPAVEDIDWGLNNGSRILLKRDAHQSKHNTPSEAGNTIDEILALLESNRSYRVPPAIRNAKKKTYKERLKGLFGGGED